MIITRDGVVFYVCLKVLRRSSNSFGHLLPAPDPPLPHMMVVPVSTTYFSEPRGSPFQSLPSPSLTYETPSPNPEPQSLSLFVPESSDTFNVIMHVIYEMPITRHAPSLETLGEALGCLDNYGIPLPGISSDVWGVLFRHAQSQPMRAFAIAASHSMEPVCVLISQLTLEVSLSSLSEADALVMGCIYLRRLVFLHLGRREALKRVVKEPPNRHAPNSSCSKKDQDAISRAWTIGVADVLIRDMPHNMPLDTLIEAFGPVVHVTHCDTCRNSTRERISKLLAEWLAVKRTI